EARAPAEGPGPAVAVVRARGGDEEGRRAPAVGGAAGDGRREADAREPRAGRRAPGLPGRAAEEAQGDEPDLAGHPVPGVQGCLEAQAGGAPEDGPPGHGGGVAAARPAEQGPAAAAAAEPRPAEAAPRGGADGRAGAPGRRLEDAPGRAELGARRAA